MSSLNFSRSAIEKWSNVPLRRKGGFVFAVPVLGLLGVGLLLGRLELAKSEAQQQHQRSLDFRAQVQNMLILLISAESEVRNYGLNGREDGIYSLGVIRGSMDAFFGRLRGLTENDGEQVAQLARLKDMVHSRLEGLKQVREYYQTNGTAVKATPPALLASAKISPDVLIAATELATAEAKSAQANAKSGAQQQSRLWAGIVASAMLGLVGGLLAMLRFTRAITRRMLGLERNASRLAEGLPSDYHSIGTDELGRLAEAIEKAGAVIAARSDQLKLALEGGEVVIWELDPDTGRLGYHAGAQNLASFPSEFLPATVNAWMASVHPEDREHAEGELNQIARQGGSFQIEYRIIPRDGRTRWMLVKARSHVLANGERRLSGVLADITARKTASQEIERQANELLDSQKALEQQTRILQSILDSMGDGVAVADTSGKFIVVNPAAQPILGNESFRDADQWARHHGLFLPDTETRYPPDQLPFYRAIRGESVDNEEIFLRPLGTQESKWISVTARPLREKHGDIQGGVLVIRDITAPKQAAAALEVAKKEAESANHAKSEFLSRMSHELRTPLNSILGFAQLLELERLSEQARDNVYHILKGGYHLLELINEILDLARIEAGRITVSLEPVCLREALKDALDLVRPLAAKKNISINPDTALGCILHVRADHQRLKQVLLNLLSNAIKFNRVDGSVVLSCVETPERALRIEVLDTGPGIKPEGLRRLFIPFERLGADGTEAGGTGLGLALSKRLMEAMGGTIGVESSVGFGSRFFIELALAEDPAHGLEHPAVAVALLDSKGSHQPKTVLYIEDNMSNLRLVERIFAHRPAARLLSAMQGQLGLDLAEFHRPDWILLDLHLPDMPGEEVLWRLQANPATAHIPVTVLSADATQGQINRLKDAGARDYLTKPLDVRKLIHLLEETISDKVPKGQSVGDEYAERNHSE